MRGGTEGTGPPHWGDRKMETEAGHLLIRSGIMIPQEME